VFTGLRPGEKLHEALIASDEWQEQVSAHGVVAAASAPRGLGDLHETMERLALLAREGADDAVRGELFSFVTPAVETAERAVAS
jgi:FlaA1/EpsC-like NDP-sugar epimerase